MEALKAWLDANAAHLATYSLDEKATLAIAAGYDRIVVSQWMTQQRFKEVA